jgi:hypothetical protein
LPPKAPLHRVPRSRRCQVMQLLLSILNVFMSSSNERHHSRYSLSLSPPPAI